MTRAYDVSRVHEPSAESTTDLQNDSNVLMDTSTPPADELDDEVSSINAIYGADTLTPLPSTTNPQYASADSRCYGLTLPSHPSVTLRIAFPTQYPSSAPPTVLGTHSVGEDVAKGGGAALAALVADVLHDVWAGAPCVFDLVEEMNSRAGEASAGGDRASDDLRGEVDFTGDYNDSLTKSNWAVHDSTGEAPQDAPEPRWVVSEAITERKSVFIARAAVVESEAQVMRFRARLVETDKRAARATHNIAAWRIVATGAETVRSGDGNVASYDDDGESAAGGRLLRLLESIDARNVLVVVSRWFGGVKLGADRFRMINLAAKQALDKGGFVPEPAAAIDKKKRGR